MAPVTTLPRAADATSVKAPASRRLDAVAWTSLGLFAIHLFLSIILVRWQIATLPVRALVGAAALALLIAARPGAVAGAAQKHPITLSVIAVVALIGAVVSFAANDAPLAILRQLLEIHVQALFAVILGGALVSLYGSAAVARLLIGVVALSSIFAIAQYSGIDIAHTAWLALQRIQPRDAASIVGLDIRLERAPGLSYSLVFLGTQICLAFAAYWALRKRHWRGKAIAFDWPLVGAVAALVVIAFVSGNRSPILGALIFLAIYLPLCGARGALTAAALGFIAVPLAPLLLDLVTAAGSRISSTEDGSALARGVLQNYGINLFLDRPLGYGLGFDSRGYWSQQWEALQDQPASYAMRAYALHNYFLNCLNKYGVSIIFVGAAALFYAFRRWALYLPLVIYVVHIFFHNDGPLQSDFLIWYVLIVLAPSAPTAMADAATR